MSSCSAPSHVHFLFRYLPSILFQIHLRTAVLLFFEIEAAVQAYRLTPKSSFLKHPVSWSFSGQSAILSLISAESLE